MVWRCFLIGSTTKCIDAYSIPFAFSLASDIGIAKETKEKFRIKSKATQDEVNSKLEITYNKDDESAASIIEITKEGHISKGTLPFSSLTDIPTTWSDILNAPFKNIKYHAYMIAQQLFKLEYDLSPLPSFL